MTKAYPSNLTWEQWELIAELFPKEKPGGRPRTVAMYAIVNAILYVLCSLLYVASLTRGFSCLVNCLWLFLEMEQRWYVVEDS
jgi:hypothetical protein